MGWSQRHKPGSGLETPSPMTHGPIGSPAPNCPASWKQFLTRDLSYAAFRCLIKKRLNSIARSPLQAIPPTPMTRGSLGVMCRDAASLPGGVPESVRKPLLPWGPGMLDLAHLIDCTKPLPLTSRNRASGKTPPHSSSRMATAVHATPRIRFPLLLLRVPVPRTGVSLRRVAAATLPL